MMGRPLAGRPLAVAIAGPTATGKTQAAVALCRALGGEVISMDSMQIYQGFDIGTAKATPGEMEGVAHHLLSIVPPDVAYSAAQYQQDARRVMEQVRGRGRLPVFAGGTGLYLQAVSRPLAFTGAREAPEVRARLEAEAQGPDGPRLLWERLAAIDPRRAQELHPNNTRRVIRALEVYAMTGRPMSEQASEWEAEPTEDWLIFALSWPREILRARIDARVDAMLAAGLVREVEGQLARGVPRTAQAMQAIGYKEIAAMLAGECTRGEAVEAIKAGTRQYAKRQITWLKRDARVRWIDLSAYAGVADMHADLISHVAACLRERAGEGNP